MSRRLLLATLALVTTIAVARHADASVRKGWHDRWRLARLRYQGFVPKFFWPATDVDWAIVTEFEAMGWFARHLFDSSIRVHGRKFFTQGICHGGGPMR